MYQFHSAGIVVEATLNGRISDHMKKKKFDYYTGWS